MLLYPVEKFEYLLLLPPVITEEGAGDWAVAKADRRPREKKKFYHQFPIVKYSYLPTDTFRKYVEMHVT